MSGVKFPVFWDLKTSETFYWHYKYAQIINPLNLAGIYMLKVNNKNFRARCEICSKLTTVSLLLTLNIFHTLF